MSQPAHKRRNLKKYGDKWKWKHNGPKSLECSKSCCKRKDYRNTGLTQEPRKISNNLTVQIKELYKEEQTKPKASGSKEIINVRVEINETETKKITKKVNETKGWFFVKINKTSRLLARLQEKEKGFK